MIHVFLNILALALTQALHAESCFPSVREMTTLLAFICSETHFRDAQLIALTTVITDSIFLTRYKRYPGSLSEEKCQMKKYGHVGYTAAHPFENYSEE